MAAAHQVPLFPLPGRPTAAGTSLSAAALSFC